MSNQKTKSIQSDSHYYTSSIANITENEIDLIVEYNNIYVRKSGHFKKAIFDKNDFEITYEKPKSNVLYAVVEPEYDTKYSYIGDNGIIMDSIWHNDSIDRSRFNLNNVFIGNDRDSNAQKQADRLKLLADIERFAVENNDEIDWYNEDQNKYFIAYDYRECKWWLPNVMMSKDSNATYFSSETLATQALEKFKDRLDLLLD